MKANLYWRLSDKHWFFTFDERPVGGSDGVEFHGEYEISMKGATLCENVLGDKMIEYKGELYDLYTSNDKRPYIIYGNNFGSEIPLYFKADRIN